MLILEKFGARYPSLERNDKIELEVKRYFKKKKFKGKKGAN